MQSIKTLLIAGVASLMVGCAASSSIPVNSAPATTDKPTVFITKKDLPENVQYEVVGVVKANARVGYDAPVTLYPMLADEARKLGGNAVINVYSGKTIHLFSWAAPYAGGTAVKIKNVDEVKEVTDRLMKF